MTARRVIGEAHTRAGVPFLIIRTPGLGPDGSPYAVRRSEAVTDYGRREREARARALLAPIFAAAYGRPTSQEA